MKLSGTVVVIVVGASLLTSVGCNRRGASEAQANASTPETAIRVTVGKPVRKTLTLATTQPARIEAFEETPLFAKLAGFVKEVRVDIGDRVASGQVLAALNIPELVNDVDQQKAMLAQSEAEVGQAAANFDVVRAAAEAAEARIAQAKASVNAATGQYERWKAEYARIKQLADNGSVTGKMADETLYQLRAAESARDEALAAVQSAEAAQREAHANVRKAEADQAAAEARIKVAAANLAHAKTMLGYAEIKAPFDGVVTQRSVDTGHFVQPAGGSGAKPLMTIARLDKVRVFVDVPEMDAALVDVGDDATLQVQSLGGKQLKAPITRTSWSLDQTNRALRAEIDVANENSLLRPGMYAVGTIQLDRRENALVVPTTAIVRIGAETYCCAVRDGKIDRRRVELGLRSGSEVEVVNGVDDQSLIVLARAEALEPGQAVEVIQTPQ